MPPLRRSLPANRQNHTRLPSHSPERLALLSCAEDYVLKEVFRRELLESIRRVLNGESALDHGVAMRLLGISDRTQASVKAIEMGLAPKA